MSIFENEQYLNPKYQHLDKYCNMMFKAFWTPAAYKSLIERQDVPHFNNILSEVDREAIRRSILAIAIVEDKVKSFWMNVHKDLPQTVVSDVGGVFSAQEVIHRMSYHHLVECLDIDTDEMHRHAATRGRIKYLNKYLENDPKIIGKKRVLKRLILFTALVERISLFTQFYILTSYSYNNKGLNAIAALQKSTAQEELYMHYAFGLDLINIIKEEHPQVWDEYLVENIVQNIKESYKAEVNLIDWFFEGGIPSHLTKEEVLNFLDYNFYELTKDLGLDIGYEYDRDMFEEKNSWFMIRINGLTNSDFFVAEIGNYSAEKEEINLEDFQF